MSKITLFLKQTFPFAGAPVSVELEPEKILCNEVGMPWESDSYSLFVIGNEYGAMGAVWAGNEGDALDELVDNDLAGGILVDTINNCTDEELEEYDHAGNAGEYVDLEHCWIAEVSWNIERDYKILCKFAEARGALVENLDKV